MEASEGSEAAGKTRPALSSGLNFGDATHDGCNLISKYEYVRLMGARVLELSHNAPPRIKDRPSGCVGALLYTAQKELLTGALPLLVVRRLPNGRTLSIDANSLIQTRDRLESIA